MQDKLHTRLHLPPGSRVLDAGAGSAPVAMFMARKGLAVHAIDITPHHLTSARKNVKKHSLQDKIPVAYANYHDLSAFPDASFDGVYTMETFVHADPPARVLAGFFRVLRPGGVLVLHEADFNPDSELLHEVLRPSHCTNTLEEWRYERLITAAGFMKFSLEDLTYEVLSLWRLFRVLGYLPYQALRLFGLRYKFTNVVAGVETWLNWGDGRYISVRAVKPLA